jgi:ribonuclease HI
MIIVHADGSCRNNPGKASCHWIYLHGDNIVVPHVYHSTDLHKATNNQAEIVAIENAIAYVLETARLHGKTVHNTDILIKTDSETACSWIKNGVNGHRVWDRDTVQKVTDNINMMRENFKSVSIVWIPRYQNKADPAHKV